MSNKIWKEFVKKVHNQNSNYEKILLKVKKEKSKKQKYLNIAAIFVMVLVIGATSSQLYAKRQWDTQFEEFQNRDYEYTVATVKEAAENGYLEEIEMDYTVQNGIGVKIDSLLITDDHFESNIHFQFPEDLEIESKTFSFGYAVYDEENRVYGVFERVRTHPKKEETYRPFLYQELGIRLPKKDIYLTEYNSGAQRGNIYASHGNIISNVTMDSVKGFPKSKKMYIRVFDLGYSMAEFETINGKVKKTDGEDFTISDDTEWIFEINVPEKMYERETVNLVLKDEIPGLAIQKLTLSETKLVLQATVNGMEVFIGQGKDEDTQDWLNSLNDKVYITDGDGNRYNHLSYGSSYHYDGFSADFAVSKNKLENQLFLNITIDGKEYKSELISN